MPHLSSWKLQRCPGGPWGRLGEFEGLGGGSKRLLAEVMRTFLAATAMFPRAYGRWAALEAIGRKSLLLRPLWSARLFIHFEPQGRTRWGPWRVGSPSQLYLARSARLDPRTVLKSAQGSILWRHFAPLRPYSEEGMMWPGGGNGPAAAPNDPGRGGHGCAVASPGASLPRLCGGGGAGLRWGSGDRPRGCPQGQESGARPRRAAAGTEAAPPGVNRRGSNGPDKGPGQSKHRLDCPACAKRALLPQDLGARSSRCSCGRLDAESLPLAR
jgi:hypothetical protein